jgi:uncharacterized protein YecA (UPF0149 family)
MNTKTQKLEKTETPDQPVEQGHVHGPNCNHHHHALAPIVRQSPKIGRNDDCLCGSKKKFKKCCGK